MLSIFLIVDFDKQVRNISRKEDEQLYAHRSCKPLDEVEFNKEDNQLDMFEPFQVIPDKTYEIIAQKNGYFNKSVLFSASYEAQQDTLKQEILLQKNKQKILINLIIPNQFIYLI